MKHSASSQWLPVITTSLLLLTIITLTCLPVHKAAAQSGFLSVDCGAPAAYLENVKKISWVTDDGFVSGGKSATLTKVTNIDLDFQSHLLNLRYFPDTAQTHFCYALPTTVGKNYLLRATFYHGGYDNNPIVKFDVAVDLFDTRETLSFDIQFNDTLVEYIFRAFKETTHFCLIRISPTDNPFISSLELRPLDESMYPAIATGSALYLNSRLKLGTLQSNTLFRYPYDPYDRFWFTLGPWAESDEIFAPTSYVKSSGYAWDKPPPAVMNTAATMGTRYDPVMSLIFTPTFPKNPFIVNVYLAELEGSDALRRVFDILVNEVVVVPNVNVYTLAKGYLYVPIEISLNNSKVNAEGKVNLTLARTASSLGPPPLLNALEFYSVHSKLEGTGFASNVSRPGGGKVNVMIIVGVSVGALLGVGVAVAIVVVLCCCRKKVKGDLDSTPQCDLPTTDVKGGGSSVGGSLARQLVDGGTRFTLAQVMDATKNNAKMLGRGGFGPVYYGKLPNGQEVAVKVSAKGSNQGSKEFINEIELLTRVHHRNLVSLVGYCDEGENLILLYEYMPRGTVQEHLYGVGQQWKHPVLDWKTRLQIALNSALGLEYLHVGCNPAIFHRDVKSNNILLDHKLLAKVADFGLSKSTDLNGDATHISTVVKGTIGYLDPEYYMSNQLTDKSDVYSFGIVLLELICARPPFVPQLPKEQQLLDKWVKPHLKAGTIEHIVDPALGGQYNWDAMWKVADLAMKSVKPKGKHRPAMSTVVHELRGALELETYDYSSTSIPQLLPPLSQGSSSGFRFDAIQSINSSVSDPHFGSNPTIVQAR